MRVRIKNAPTGKGQMRRKKQRFASCSRRFSATWGIRDHSRQTEIPAKSQSPAHTAAVGKTIWEGEEIKADTVALLCSANVTAQGCSNKEKMRGQVLKSGLSATKDQLERVLERRLYCSNHARPVATAIVDPVTKILQGGGRPDHRV